MLVTDDEVKDLKLWLVKKLEAISEADSQILSDYVLALLQADSSESELQANAIENLADFLGDNTRKFVNDIFTVIRTKAYLPGHSSLPSQPPTQALVIADEPHQSFKGQQEFGSRNGSAGRKRSYNESNAVYIDYDAPVKKQYDRRTKHPRDGLDARRGREMHTGNGREVNQDRYTNGRMAHSPHDSRTAPRFPLPNRVGGDFQIPSVAPTDQALGLPNPGSVPFDPNAAIQAVMTLQAMGFPIPLPGSTPSTAPPYVRVKSQKRCRDYDSKGYCLRGETCLFKHQDKNSETKSTIELEESNRSGIANDGHPLASSKNSITTKGGAPRSSKARAPFSASMVQNKRGMYPGIVVENIPEDYFNHDQIKTFFSNFGTIKSIVMRAYHHLAIVEYDNPSSARAAVESPKVVFDNRFVKVFFYIPGLDDKRTNGMIEPMPVSTPAEEKPEFDKEQFEKDNEAAQKKHLARQVLLEETERKRLELAAKQQEIEDQKAEELRKLKDRLTARGESIPPDIERAINTSTKNDETETLLAQLKALEDEAKSLGIDAEPWFSGSHGFAYRGRGSYRGWRGYYSRGRGRGGYSRGGMIGNGAYNLDNRPKSVRVEGVEFDDLKDESLKQFLFTLGDFVSVEPDTDRRSQVITFKDRSSAETFYYGSKDIPGVGKLQFAWEAVQTSTAASNNVDTDMRDVDDQSSTKLVNEAEEAAGFAESDVQREDEANDSGEDYEWIT